VTTFDTKAIELIKLLFCIYTYYALTYLLTDVHTYSMEQSPSWEANRVSASQKNSPHFVEPEGSLPLSQVPAICPYPEPARSSPCHHFLKIHPSIILPSTSGSSKLSLSFRFPYQNPVYTSALPHTCYMPRPSHPCRFDHPNNICWRVQIIKLLVDIGGFK